MFLLPPNQKVPKLVQHIIDPVSCQVFKMAIDLMV